MKYTIKYSEFSKKWFVHLKSFGQIGESYSTEEEANKALKHYTEQISTYSIA